MNKFDLDENKSIMLIPSFTIAFYPVLSITASILVFLAFDRGEFKGEISYWALIAMALLGFVPILLSPYKLYNTRENFVLKKPFGRIEVIAKSQAMTVDKFWAISGLYNTHTFGKNFHNNKKIVKFIKRHMNKQQRK